MSGKAQIRVAIDVGMKRHWVGIAGDDGTVAEEFAISHDRRGFEEFFRRVERRQGRSKRPVAVAMEGYNGWARPLDGMIQRRGWELLNVNNLKLARYKEIFPGPAKSDSSTRIPGAGFVRVRCPRRCLSDGGLTTR